MTDDMAKMKILLVEDDPAGRELARFNLEKSGYLVDAVADGERALAVFSPNLHALVITDLRMPGIDGMTVLARIRERSPDTPVLVITAYGSVELAVTAMKQGAYDFIGKPFNRDHLLLTVRRALEGSSLRREVRSLKRQVRGVERPIIGQSEAMERVKELADRVADSDASVLITGETGTGKELVARRIHARSRRSDAPFVAVNCAAVPPELLESELFGHVKGAFTGAHRAHRGRFRSASGGTLLLDEIGELPLALQGKLLRVLAEHVVDVVGADAPEPVDVRLLASTNKDLTALVRTGEFRQDLLYRLNVVEIHVPSLAERRKDIAPLVRHFVAEFSRNESLEVPDVVIVELEGRDWPGNVRQLQNACERMVLLSRGETVSVDDLPPRVSTQPVDDEQWPGLPPEGVSLFDVEKRVITRVLELKGGNVSQAAQHLKIPRHILAYRLAKYGIGKS